MLVPQALSCISDRRFGSCYSTSSDLSSKEKSVRASEGGMQGVGFSYMVNGVKARHLQELVAHTRCKQMSGLSIRLLPNRVF